MQTKKYLITNNSEGSICITGRTRIDIPGMCKDLPISLPENTARQTVLRLKQRYPLLKIVEAQENQAGNNSKADPNSDSAPRSDGHGSTANKGNSISEPDNSQNPTDAEVAPDKSQTASSTGSSAPMIPDAKNGSQDTSSQNQASTQKPDNKKGK